MPAIVKIKEFCSEQYARRLEEKKFEPSEESKTDELSKDFAKNAPSEEAIVQMIMQDDKKMQE